MSSFDTYFWWKLQAFSRIDKSPLYFMLLSPDWFQSKAFISTQLLSEQIFSIPCLWFVYGYLKGGIFRKQQRSNDRECHFFVAKMGSMKDPFGQKFALIDNVKMKKCSVYSEIWGKSSNFTDSNLTYVSRKTQIKFWKKFFLLKFEKQF